MRIFRYIPPYFSTLIVFLAVCYLSLAPDPMPESQSIFDFPGADKVLHFVMYCGLTTTFCFDHYRRPTHRQNERIVFIIALITASIAGGIIEILQHTMNMGRSGDIADFVADIVGACAGIGMGVWLFAGRWVNAKQDNSSI